MISEKGPKTNPESRYFLSPFIPTGDTDIVAYKPIHWIGFGSRYGLCVLKGFSMFPHNIYQKIFLCPSPLGVHTDCSCLS